MQLTEKQKALIEKYVADVQFAKVTPRTIFCVLVLKSGWESYGISACRDMEKFDAEKGQSYAFFHAISRLEYNVDKGLEV